MVTILLCFAFCFIIERIFTGWKLPKISSWPLRTIFLHTIQLGIVLLAGITWEKWALNHSLFQLSNLVGPWTGGFIAYFIATFVFYWWHRLRHESDFFWKYFHQIHHSPQRLEVITSFYKHPLEMIVNSIIGSLLVYVLFGLSVEAGAIYTFFTAIGEFVYHTNIRTPQWLGYIFQRPEMHRIHHQYKYHKNNYGDIVWWDMLFGTYENPKTWDDKCGFDLEKEEKLFSMLKFNDVHKKITAGFLAVCLLIPQISQACSVVKTQNKRGEMVVAKNFDWLSGEGLIVSNPRKQIRSSLNGKRKWTAKYASTSFTTVGPGFPVSSLNEKGLIVEALVDLDSYNSGAQKEFTSLGWAQYILDNFSTLEEVKNFARYNPYTQIIVPLHFFICDRDGECGVFESRGHNNNKIKITSGNKLKKPVLANKAYNNDYAISKLSFFKRYKQNLNPYSSGKRFTKLADEGFLFEKNSQEEIFDQLNNAKIPGLNQWQIIWDPTQQMVNWKKKGSNKIFSLSTLHKNSCTRQHQVMALDQLGKYKRYNHKDAKETQNRIIEASLKRTGRRNNALAKKVARFTLKSKCAL